MAPETAGFVRGAPSGLGDELMRALIRHAHESADVAQANTALGEFAGGLSSFLGGVVLRPRGLLPQRASGLKVARNRVGLSPAKKPAALGTRARPFG